MKGNFEILKFISTRRLCRISLCLIAFQGFFLGSNKKDDVEKMKIEKDVANSL